MSEKTHKSYRLNTTVRLDNDVREFLRKKSFDERISISDIVNDIVREKMNQKKRA